MKGIEIFTPMSYHIARARRCGEALSNHFAHLLSYLFSAVLACEPSNLDGRRDIEARMVKLC